MQHYKLQLFSFLFQKKLKIGSILGLSSLLISIVLYTKVYGSDKTTHPLTVKRIWRQGDIAGFIVDKNDKLTTEIEDYEPHDDNDGGATVSPAVISRDFETIVQHVPGPSNISKFSVSSKESLSCTRTDINNIKRDNIPPELYKVAEDVSPSFSFLVC